MIYYCETIAKVRNLAFEATPVRMTPLAEFAHRTCQEDHEDGEKEVCEWEGSWSKIEDAFLLYKLG